MVLFILIPAFVIAIAFLWYKQQQSELRLKQLLLDSEAKLSKSLFRCVKIDAGNHACQFAIAYQNKPILVDQAPVLPLPGCDVVRCQCQFLRFDDRREGRDRREKQSKDDRRAMIYAEKRLIKDRRKSSLRQLFPNYNRPNYSR
ncbi:MAG TPA: hypothetical protein DCO68_08070 [Methylophilaceae bacterium]|nr:hypothetical protein [Methylophilaceae bacterium]HAJ72022.1 hypothetical protein [Methylophilaceae bacterium]